MRSSRWSLLPLSLLVAACVSTSPADATPPQPVGATASPAPATATLAPADPGTPPGAGVDRTAGRWNFGARMPTPRSEMPAVELGGLIYVPGGFGGIAALEAYNPVTDSWDSLTAMPDGRHHVMAAALDDRLYVFGGSPLFGFSPTNTAWAFDPATRGWADLPPMPEGRTAGVAVTLGRTIYVIGGTGGSGDMLAFSPDEGLWRSLSGPAQPREHVNAVALEGEIWVIGGRWRGAGELASVEIYSLETGAWREGPPLNIPRAGFAAAVLDGTPIVAGGEVIFTGNETLGSVEVYDPMQGRWLLGPALPHPVHGVDAAIFEGRYYLMGGSDAAGGVNNQGRVQIYITSGD